MMIDSYATLIKMVTDGADPVVIAAATGWPIDAVQTLSQELTAQAPTTDEAQLS